MVVRVTDASGKPIAGKTVSWQLTSITPGTAQPAFDPTTVTDSNGLSISRLANTAFGGGTAITPFLQSVITASVDAASANFTETVGLTDLLFGGQIVLSRIIAPIGTPLTGPAGGTGTSPVIIHVDGRGVPVPNVSVRIFSDDPKNQPSASCATAPGADPGSVLTNASGDATCYPVFGPIAGNGPVSVLVGGLDPAEFDQTISPVPLTGPLAYDQYLGIQLAVSAVSPGVVSVVSGNNQTVNPGQASAPLGVKVTDATGAVNIGGTTVNWTVTPAGAATP